MERETLRHAELVASHDAPQGRDRRRRPRPAGAGRRLDAGVTIVGKTWACTCAPSCTSARDENLRMIDESVAYLNGQGKRVIYDSEHFFDAWATTRATPGDAAGGA